MNSPAAIQPQGAQQSAEHVVRRFLKALEAKDHDQIAHLLSPDLHYTNVSLPTLRGGKQVSKLFKKLMVKDLDITLHIHELACTGNTVMTERTDAFSIGPFHMRFWVFGNFHVENGKITLWRDYFDWMNITGGLLTGFAGIAFKSLRNKPFSTP